MARFRLKMQSRILGGRDRVQRQKERQGASNRAKYKLVVARGVRKSHLHKAWILETELPLPK
jgi:hypothetical protein